MPGGVYPPASVIASWPKPNYVDPITRGDALTNVCIAFPAIGIVLVLARIYSRVFITKAPGLDDVLIIFAVAFGTALAVLVVVGDKVYYTGRHVWDVPIDKFSGGRLNVWICQWCYIMTSCCVKISILLFYRRLSVIFSKTFLLATWTGIIYNICYMITFLLVLLFQCSPINSYWLQVDQAWLKAGNTYTCGSNEHRALPLSGALSMVADFYSTMLPLCLVYSLDLPKRQKAALYGLFALGFLVVLAGVFRTVLLNRVINETFDFTWTMWEMWIWTIVEVYVAIFAASAPALRPLFCKFFVNPMTAMGFENGYGEAKAYNKHRSEKSLRAGGNSGTGTAMWSEDDTTVQKSYLDGNQDLEKIGVAVTCDKVYSEDDELEIREYRYLDREGQESDEIGLALPLQHARGQQSLDLQSDLGQSPSQTESMTRRGSQDWVLPPISAYDDSLRQYRAQLEPLPALPTAQSGNGPSVTVGRHGISHHIPGQQRLSTSPGTETGGSTAVGAPVARYSSRRQQSIDGPTQPTSRTLSGLEQHPSHNRVRAQPGRARQTRIARVRDISGDEEVDYSQQSLPDLSTRRTLSPLESRFQDIMIESRLDLTSEDEDEIDARVYDKARLRDMRRNVSGDRRTRRTNEFRDASEEASLEDQSGNVSSDDTLQLPRMGSKDGVHI